jgi:hypothetical protein
MAGGYRANGEKHVVESYGKNAESASVVIRSESYK